MAFFPQLLAGPIARATTLLPQFFEKHEFNSHRVSDGLKQMMWGFFKKVVIADRLAILVNQVYDNAGNYEGVPLLLATYFFAFQIYCDFSGYSDIAIGAAQVMGFKLMDNFNRPYHAKSIAEFWTEMAYFIINLVKRLSFLPISYSLTRKLNQKKYFNIRSDKIIYTMLQLLHFYSAGYGMVQTGFCFVGRASWFLFGICYLDKKNYD